MLREFEAVRAKVKTSKLWAFMYPRKPRVSKGRKAGRKMGARKTQKRRGEGEGKEKGGEWPSCCIL